MRSRPLHSLILSTVAAVALSSCAGAPEAAPSGDGGDGYPLTITSCGFESTLEAQPTRAITMNQGATEVMLALGLSDHLAGTAYLDDEVPDKWKEAYESVPVLAEEYPDHETVLSSEPDFVYASYVSAFGEEAAGSRESLADLGVASYLSPFGCEDADARPPVEFEHVWAEIADIGRAFGVTERAEELIAEQRASIADLGTEAVGEGLDIFWFDSGDRTALAGVGGGGPQLIIDAVGGTNVFADAEGGWSEVSWEDVIAADPDVIVLAEAAWSSAQEKIDYLENDPVLSQLRAVREKAYATVWYSESTPGARLADGAASLAEQLADLD